MKNFRRDATGELCQGVATGPTHPCVFSRSIRRVWVNERGDLQHQSDSSAPRVDNGLGLRHVILKREYKANALPLRDKRDIPKPL